VFDGAQMFMNQVFGGKRYPHQIAIGITITLNVPVLVYLIAEVD